MAATTPKVDKYGENDERSGGKGRGGKLARRARSFKEDFLEKLSQMRSPGVGTASGIGGGGGGTVTRASSPSSPRTPCDKTEIIGDSLEKNPLRDLDVHVRQVRLALLHFRDVVSKKKLEMLPGNGTVVLDTVTTIHTVLKSYFLHENSSSLGSATNQVYQALAQLLKLCDDALLHGDGSSVLETENVNHVIGLVEDAVNNLVALAREKIAIRQKPTLASATVTASAVTAAGTSINNNRTSGYGSDLAPQRNSLPDIPLTPRERQILEQTATSGSLVRSSHSSESILRDSSPPPKPPLPDRFFQKLRNAPAHRTSGIGDRRKSSTPPPPPPPPPPLPPKRRTRAQRLLDESDCLPASNLDRVSLRSRSPEDTSSLLSASAGSLDSALDHSRDEDEIRAIMGLNDESLNNSMDLSLAATIRGMRMNGSNGGGGCCWDNLDPSMPSTMLLGQETHRDILGPFAGIEGMVELASTQTRESGFASMHSSQRGSSQSYASAIACLASSSSSNSGAGGLETRQFSFASQRAVLTTDTTMVTHRTTSNTASGVAVNIYDESPNLYHAEKSQETETSIESDANGTIPPALPEKRSKRRKERLPSQYDNVPENEQPSTRDSREGDANDSPDASKPPPLPLKKRHIMAYMEMFGNCSHSSNDFISGLGTRHSVAAYNSLQAEWQQHETSLTTTQSCSSMVHTMSLRENSASSVSITVSSNAGENTENTESIQLPPALPPKRSRSIKSDSAPPTISSKPNLSAVRGNVDAADPIAASSPTKPRDTSSIVGNERKISPSLGSQVVNNSLTLESPLPCSGPMSDARSSASIDEDTLELRDIDRDDSILDELDINKYLVLKKSDEDGPEIRGGNPDALLVHATRANKHDFLYQEAFLTTYRTFVSPLELIKKLHKRHQRFSCAADVAKQRSAREAFSLLVRVVSDLTISDLDDVLLRTLMEFVQQLVCGGDLTMAKALRVKILEKHAAKRLQATQPILSSLGVSTKQASLLDFKSEQIAEQMTYLDAELFMKIEIPEVLVWAQEQNEERSPNLTRFTEHFNKMSYWARSRILEHRMENEAKDRERYVVKFIKIMKHLRKINNFNSYLALLSALDSAPIRRLEWQKHITEGLKEYCALIDSSSSFRAYRQALAETQPPCIPYIGLVLQDLTFVHIGNSDLLPDGTINFSKRWQQFNIVENMKRFKKGTYSFKKHDKIITFFNNFSDFLCEDAMWQISESIKPRGGKKLQAQN